MALRLPHFGQRGIGMSATKSRGQTRSGVARRSVTRRTYDDIHQWVAASNAQFDEAKVRAEAAALLDELEQQAFEVYGRHGLPTFYKCWRAGPDQPWLPAEERSDAATVVGERFTNADVIGAEAAPDDSEVGFATAILKGAVDARRRLIAADDLAAWRAFLDGASLAGLREVFHLEFELAPWVGPGRLQALGRRRGGVARAAEARAKIDARRRAWADENAKLDPALPARSRARLIARRMRNTEFAASEETIRKHLAKNGS